MGVLQPLEKPLAEINAKLPAFPKGLKDFLATAAPWLSLLGGIFAAWSAYNIWRWADAVNRLADWANSWSTAFGGTPVSTTRWSLSLYLAVGVLVVSAIIYFLAFSPLKSFKKAGWDLLFLAVAVNFVYGIVILFGNNYGGAGNFIGQLIGTAISLYILFQIRDYYTGKAKVAAKPAAPASQNSSDDETPKE